MPRSAGPDRPLQDPDHLREVVASACFTPPAPAAPSPGRAGLEAELFAFQAGPAGEPRGRVPLARLLASLERLAAAGALAGARRLPGEPPRFRLAGGGLLSFEPGGQLEHSTAAHPGAGAALAELEGVLPRLASALEPEGIVLAAAGLDVWQAGARPVPQQLAAPRYPAMAAYFARRGPDGAVMMRASCALQLNLDLGGPGELRERWLAANLAAPLACATFAASPAPGAASARALTWQRLDPTRTGFPRGLLEGVDDPVEQLTRAALAADVLLVRCRRGYWEAGRPGWTFADWLREGHPQHGYPTADDLRYHLTTLFFEVRPRGFLELRTVDALPARYRPVPVVLLAGLLADPGARREALACLAPFRPQLPALMRRAATAGLRDPELARLAARVWPAALAGAGRLPPGTASPAHLALAARFLDRLTLRGRCPADELRAALARGPAAALAWAAEPAAGSPPPSPGAGPRRPARAPALTQEAR